MNARELSRTSFALLLLMLTTSATAPRRPKPRIPAGMSAVEADTLLTHYAKDREDTREWLKGKPTSYLATILRRDFDAKTSLTVGSDPGCDVRP